MTPSRTRGHCRCRWSARSTGPTPRAWPGSPPRRRQTSAEISRIRRGEGAASAALLGGKYHCLEEPDLNVFYSERTLAKATRLLREVRPRLVLLHSPADYMLDHEQASVIGRAAAFAA